MENSLLYNPIHIRWMITKDYNSVIEIEKKSFDVPWTIEELKNTLRQENLIGQVAVMNDKVVGYMIYEIYDSYYDILSLAVDPKHRRERIATMMINKIIRKMNPNRTSVLTCIREKNLAGQLFFKKQEFICTEILKNYYANTNEPAYLMEYHAND